MQKMVNETKKVFGDKEKKKKKENEGNNNTQEIQNDIRDGINYEINKELNSNNENHNENENNEHYDIINFNTTDIIPISSNNNTNSDSNNGNGNYPSIVENTQQNGDLISFDTDTNIPTFPQQQNQQNIDNFFSSTKPPSPFINQLQTQGNLIDFS